MDGAGETLKETTSNDKTKDICNDTECDISNERDVLSDDSDISVDDEKNSLIDRSRKKVEYIKYDTTVYLDFIYLICSQIKCMDSKLVSFLLGVISCKTCDYFILSPMFMMCTIWLFGILNGKKEQFISIYYSILLLFSWFLDDKLCIPICELMLYCYEYYTTKKFDVCMGSSMAYAFACLSQPSLLHGLIITAKHFCFLV
tara:strand:+ start:614 stop:1216 length:603 start_codon:yes stop_codon:yes gene_type:complete